MDAATRTHVAPLRASKKVSRANGRCRNARDVRRRWKGASASAGGVVRRARTAAEGGKKVREAYGRKCVSSRAKMEERRAKRRRKRRRSKRKEAKRTPNRSFSNATRGMAKPRPGVTERQDISKSRWMDMLDRFTASCDTYEVEGDANT